MEVETVKTNAKSVRRNGLTAAIEKWQRGHALQAEALREMVEAAAPPDDRWVPTAEMVATLPFGRSKLDFYLRRGEFSEGEHFVMKANTRYWSSAAMANWMATSDRLATGHRHRGRQEPPAKPPVAPLQVTRAKG